jgi:twitching motility protein PilT
MANQPATAPNAAQPSGAAFNFKAILQQMIQQNASDLHLKVGRPPTLRVNGDLSPLQLPPMRPEDLKSLAEQVMTPKQV